MGLVHVSSEELSALLDGELGLTAERLVRRHLAECPECSAEYAIGLRLDHELRQPPALTCDAVQELLSATIDHQASDPERAAAQRHLAGCDSCQASVQEWAQLATALRALPLVAPSARVDRAVRGLLERRRSARTAHVGGIAARSLIAVTAVFAVLIAGLNGGGRAPIATLPPTSEQALVAAVQQVVFNPRNNTFYMLEVSLASVDARDAETNELKARISVGGEPTALALNEAANTILVLDASSKRLTEIDAANNTVIGTSTVAVQGTPTSISVDPSNSNIVVTVTAPKAPAEKSPAGAVAVFNGTTKQLETVREINVAPRLVVLDPNRGRSALVSADATTIVDSAYKVVETLPGGVGAAFSRRDDTLAVLSVSGDDSRLAFYGPLAPQHLTLRGAPRALTALPDGGYLVLTASPGYGQVSRITRGGAVLASVEVAATTGDLIYDPATNRFMIASGGRFDTAGVPGEASAASSPTQPAVTSPSSVPAASASPSPSADASPTSTATSVATPGPATAATRLSGNLFDQAKPVAPNLETIALPNGVTPQIAAVSGARIWFVDQANGVHAFNTGTGQLLSFGQLRVGTRIKLLAAGPSYAFGVDAATGEVSVVSLARMRIETYATNVLSPVSAIAVGTDDRLWIALRDADYLLAFDPKTQRMDSFDLKGTRISALTIDQSGRIYYADDTRGAVGTFDQRTSIVNEVGFVRRGTTTALLVDETSTLWIGTSTGEVYAVRGGGYRLTVNLPRPVTALALSHAGRAWYLAPMPGGPGGYIYAPADGSAAPRSIPGPVLSLSFNPLGRAFLADAQGGIYMSTEGAR